jgi:hypothetical protein
MVSFNNGMDDNVVGTNKELLYVSHILSTLKDAQVSFGGQDGKMNVDRFMLYCAYLESAILNDKTRDQVMIERTKEKARLIKEGITGDILHFYEGFVTIKYVMKYLNDVMELEHRDIVGLVGKEVEIGDEEYDLFEDENI